MKNKGTITVLTILYLMLFMCLLSGCKESEKSYDLSLDAYMNDDYVTAIKKAETSVSQGKNDMDVFALLSLSYEKNRDIEKALSYAEKAYLCEETPTGLKMLGIYELNAGNEVKAEMNFRQVISINKDPECYSYLGDLYFNRGSFDMAKEMFEEALNQSYHVAYQDMMLGLIYLSMDQTYAACQYFDLLEGKNELEPSWCIRIFRALSEKKEYTKAQKYFEMGLNLFDGKRDTKMTVSEYYLLAGKITEAKETFSDGDSAESALLGAEYMLDIGDYESADILYLEALEKDPENMSTYVSYMAFQVLMGKETEALQLLSVINASDNEHAKREALWNLVVMKEIDKEYKEAYDLLLEYMNTYGSDEKAIREEAFLSRVKKGY